MNDHSRAMYDRIFLCLCTAVLVLLSQQGNANDLPLEALTIHSAETTSEFQVEVATTPDERATGLMYRESLADDQGMLFVYETPRIVAMWMKNTSIPLDMLFIHDDGIIVNIAHRTEPHSLTVIRSVSPVTQVLELAGGTVDRLGIQVGDRVHRTRAE